MPTDLLKFTGSCELTAAAGDGPGRRPPRVSIVAYAGGAMAVSGFGQVVVDLRGLELSASIPLLADHKADLDSTVGVGKPNNDGRQLTIVGTLVDSATAAKIVALAAAGVPLGASIGAEPIEREFIQPGSTCKVNGRNIVADGRGLVLVRRARLREVSILSLAADAATSVAIAAGLRSTKGSSIMPTNETQTDSHENADLLRAAERAGLPENAPGIGDTERISARWNRERWHDPTSGPYARGQRAMIAAAAGKISYQEFERELLEARVHDAELRAIRAERPQGPGIYASRHDGGGGSPDAVLEGALLCHMGREGLGEKLLGAPAMQRARDLHCRSLLDVFSAAVMQAKGSVPHGTDAMLRAASTINAPAIFSNVANKILQDAYAAFPSAARTISKKLSSKDFKTSTGVRLTGSSAFEELPPDGTIKHGHLTDATFTYRIATFAKMFSLDRSDIINDDLSAFDQVPSLLARGAALKLEEAFFGLLLANASSFFGAGNSNLKTGVGSALSVAGLTDAYQALLGFTDDQGLPIMAAPKFLLVPPALAVAAKALVASITTQTSGGTDSVVTPTSNPLSGLADVVVSPFLAAGVLTGGSNTAWYLLCDPGNVAATGIAFLNNQETPTIEQSDANFDQLGIQFRGYHDFGCVLVDAKGGVKSAGA